jgi:ParB family transcriptional regulator, chromosome partitioning protein
MTTAFQNNDVVSIPLNKLVSAKDNVRKTGIHDEIGELKASIAAQGILQSLVVKKTSRGKFAVIAGQRRLLALSALADDGAIAGDTPVPCCVKPGTADATEIGLTENVVRAPMHPADQFEAFRDLIDGGSTPAGIAARFGISEVAVKQRLKLARVSPAVFQAYRDAELTLEQVQAFTVSDDHAAQDHLLENLSEWNQDPDDIRNALTQDDIAATDRRARFVTLPAYEEAGGTFRRDLFAEGDEGVFLLDAELLDRLALEKLQAEAEVIKAEGWKWVEAAVTVDRSEMDFRVRRPEPLPLSEEALAEQKRLSEEYSALFESADEHDEETSERLDGIESRIAELEKTERAYTPDVMAIAGAILTIRHDGETEILRGLVRPDDEPDAEDRSESETKKERPEFSSKLVQSLTAAKSAAIGAAMSDNPTVALAAVVHGLAMSVFDCFSGDARLQVRGDVTQYGDATKGAEDLKRAYEKWSDTIPGEESALWEWCLAQEQSILLDLLAFCAGCTVDAVTAKLDSVLPRISHGDALAAALKLDMKEWFTPTAENYFSRVGRQSVVNAITEAKGIPAKRSWQKLKKSELAALAEREIAGTGWLPSILKA